MKILGWIREGDQAACGGTVAEGFPTTISHGRPLTYQHARMACMKGCVIAEATPGFTLPNGRPVPHHGHVTSGGCPLISTLNDIHGKYNEGAKEASSAFEPDSAGNWTAGRPTPSVRDKKPDYYLVLKSAHHPTSTRNSRYRVTLNTGQIIEGRTDEVGNMLHALSDESVVVSIELDPKR